MEFLNWLQTGYFTVNFTVERQEAGQKRFASAGHASSRTIHRASDSLMSRKDA
jgi:hypothetical protein